MRSTRARIALSLAILFVPLAVMWLTVNWDSPFATALPYLLATIVGFALTRLMRYPRRRHQKRESEGEAKG